MVLNIQRGALLRKTGVPSPRSPESEPPLESLAYIINVRVTPERIRGVLNMTTNAENSITATTIVGRPFPKGVSGNPGGRPKGLAAYARDQTFDGEEIVNLMLSVMRGEKVGGLKPTVSHMMDATTWLSDRGFGKSLQQARVDVNDNRASVREELRRLFTFDELLAIRDQMAALERALPEGKAIDGEAPLPSIGHS